MEPNIVGFWNWLFDSLSGGSGQNRRASGSGSAVGVLEPPQESDTEFRWWEDFDGAPIELQPVPEPELTIEDRALENILVSHATNRDLDLPPLPGVVERVLLRLRGRDFAMAEVANDIAEDQVIAAAIVRMANSPLFKAVGRIESLQSAVSRLGASAIRTLMMHQALRAATFQRRGLPELAQALWQRSLASACLMGGLAPIVGLDEQKSFLIGLLNDIGSVIVLRETAKQRKALGRGISAATFEYLCDKHHEPFGALIAEPWNLPSNVAEIVADHQRTPDSEDPLRTERLTLQLVHMINGMVGCGYPADYDILRSVPVTELGLGDRDEFIRFLLDAPSLIESSAVSFSA